MRQQPCTHIADRTHALLGQDGGAKEERGEERCADHGAGSRGGAGEEKPSRGACLLFGALAFLFVARCFSHASILLLPAALSSKFSFLDEAPSQSQSSQVSIAPCK